MQPLKANQAAQGLTRASCRLRLRCWLSATSAATLARLSWFCKVHKAGQVPQVQSTGQGRPHRLSPEDRAGATQLTGIKIERLVSN